MPWEHGRTLNGRGPFPAPVSPPETSDGYFFFEGSLATSRNEALSPSSW